ncbi:carbohydrate-binding family 9-like protein [Paenibacillus oryzisoli]|uniref:carbohydrate-binding family 9-like protein n=1 Tax=Paenibacillus oryzisoli TaxID=1850517 RepID=UPI003D294F5A
MIEMKPLYVCAHMEIDSFPSFDDELWERLSSINLRDTVSGGKPRLSTTVESFWNRERAAIYFRFSCEDDHLVSTMTNHDDSIYEEDVVEVFICETGDLAWYKEFEVSPTNVKFDAIIHNDPLHPPIQVGRDWHADGWKTATRYVHGRYMSIWEIPFCNFTGGIPSAGDVWRMNCYRIDRGNGHPDEYTAWSPTEILQFHTPNKFGYLQFA